MTSVAVPADPKRARIGLIIPSANRAVEQDLLPALPADVGGHVTRVRVRGVATGALLAAIEQAAGLLADAGCGVVVFQCTASSMEGGVALAEQVLNAIRDGAPRAAAVSTASALLDALRVLSIRRLALLTPYSEAVTARQRGFFEQAGIEVVAHCARDLNRLPNYGHLPAAFWLDALQAFMPADAPAVLLSCANLPLLELVDEAERMLGRPVLTSNQAVLWAALRHAGVDAPLEGLGRLGGCALPLRGRAA